MTFSGSQLVWQYYPGQGIQVQWLGTFGRGQRALPAAAAATTSCARCSTRRSRLATPRAGGIAWESLFRFDGGAPPWVSGLSQGTAIQAFSRAAARLDEPRYFEAARAALGIFRTAPPEGVRVDTPAGAHYLQYSFAPGLRILNGFIQALNGLFDFAALANDAEGRALFAAGEAEARVELPTLRHRRVVAATGPARRADLGYHKLAARLPARRCASASPDPALYCTRPTASPPTCASRRVLAAEVAPSRWPAKPVELVFTLNKVSIVTLTMLRKGKPVLTRSARFGYGRHALRRPPAPGAARSRCACARSTSPATSAPSPGGSRCAAR